MQEYLACIRLFDPDSYQQWELGVLIEIQQALDPYGTIWNTMAKWKNHPNAPTPTFIKRKWK